MPTLEFVAVEKHAFGWWTFTEDDGTPVTGLDKSYDLKFGDSRRYHANYPGQYCDVNYYGSITFANSDLTKIRDLVAAGNIITSMSLWLPKQNSGEALAHDTIRVGVNRYKARGTTITDLILYGDDHIVRNIGEKDVWITLTNRVIERLLDDFETISLGKLYNDNWYYYTGSAYPILRVEYQYGKTTVDVDKTALEFGDKIKCTLTPSFDYYTHKLALAVGSATQEVSLEAGITEHEFTVPLEWCSQIPDAVETIGTVSVTSYVDGEEIGVETEQIQLSVPASIKPNPGSLGYTVDNVFNLPITNRGIRVYLSGQSGVYGSTIKNYILSGDGYTSIGQNLSIDSLQVGDIQSGQRIATFTANVTDSRGRTVSTTLDVTIYEWDMPFFSELEYYRCNSSGEKSESGHYIRVRGKYECYSVNGQNELQPCTIKIVERSTGTEISGGNLAQDTPKIVGNGLLKDDEEYALQLTLTDKMLSVVREHSIYSVAFVIHFRNGGTGVAFGQAATEDDTVRVNPVWHFIVGDDIDVAATITDILQRLSALEGN